MRAALTTMALTGQGFNRGGRWQRLSLVTRSGPLDACPTVVQVPHSDVTSAAPRGADATIRYGT